MHVIRFVFFFGSFGYIVTQFNFDPDHDQEHVMAIIQRCTGTCNPKYCKMFHSCRPHNRTSKIRKLDVYFNEGVKLDAPINLEFISYKKFRTVYRPLMAKFKIELCDFLAKRQHPLFSFFALDELKGTLFDRCPLSGHRFHAPRYTSSWLPTLVPTGEWRIDFNMTTVTDGVDEPIASTSYYAIIKAKDATEF